MPYLKPERRPRFNTELKALSEKIECTGDLNYCVSALAWLFLEKLGLNYDNASRARAGLSDADSEFYLTAVFPYEKEKRMENGSVLPLKFSESPL